MFRARTAAAAVAAALVLAACTTGDDGPFDGTLEVGLVLPQSGELSYLAPAQVAAVEVALAEINEAGGVWGNDVTVEQYDEGDGEEHAEAASASAQALVAAGVDAVIGATATGRTLEIIEPLREAGIVQVSPASPGIVLDEHPAREYYFRVAPSDLVQGAALGQELVGDGHQRLAIVARDDTYGESLAALTRERYETDPEDPEVEEGELQDAREVVADIRFDPDDPDVDAVVDEVAAAEPDAVLVISFEEGTPLLTGLAEAELAPADETAWYLVNGNLADYSDELPEGTLEGVTATAPAPAPEAEDLYERMDEHTAGLTDYLYGAEAYDAMIVLALGAVVADTDDPDERRAAMVDVSRDPGTACGTFADCLEALDEDEEINYIGQSGPISWSDAGDPQGGQVGIYEYDADNTFTRERVEPVAL